MVAGTLACFLSLYMRVRLEAVGQLSLSFATVTSFLSPRLEGLSSWEGTCFTQRPFLMALCFPGRWWSARLAELVFCLLQMEGDTGLGRW